MNETTLITSESLSPTVEEYFVNEKINFARHELAAVSVMLPAQNIDEFGIYYALLKQLAWNRINVVEVISTAHEVSFIVSKEDIDQVFSLFMNMKSK